MRMSEQVLSGLTLVPQAREEDVDGRLIGPLDALFTIAALISHSSTIAAVLIVCNGRKADLKLRI